MKILAILLFGVLGVLSRYSIESIEYFNLKTGYATFIVNMLGCLMAGFLYASDKFNEQWTLILLVGLCGGLTTFSGHILQSLKMLENGEYLQSSLYLIFTPLLGMLMLVFGIRIARLLL